MTEDQGTAERSVSGYATMGRSDLQFEARAVNGDVVIGGIHDYYQLLTVYLSPEKARELLQQINTAAAEAMDYRLSGEIDEAEERAAAEGGESE